MVAKNNSLVWTKQSQKQIKQIYNYISNDSVTAAQKVTDAIVEAVKKALVNPERYNPDKYKNNNDGSFRAFEIHHYRVSYRFEKNVVRVLRIRHTKMNPQSY